jgi:hypothetical protein
MSLGMGIFLAALVWGAVTIFQMRNASTETASYPSFLKGLGRVFHIMWKAVTFGLSSAVLISILVLCFYLLMNLTSSLANNTFSFNFFEWNFVEIGTYVVALLGFSGVFILIGMILGGEGFPATAFDKLIYFISMGRVKENWRDTEQGDERNGIIALKFIHVFGFWLSLRLVPSAAEFLRITWQDYIVPFYFQHSGFINLFFVACWLGYILIGFLLIAFKKS